MKACCPGEGISGIPHGAEFYQQCLIFQTSLELTPQEIHDLGLKEVARIRAEIEKVKQTMHHCSTINHVQAVFTVENAG